MGSEGRGSRDHSEEHGRAERVLEGEGGEEGAMAE